MCEGAAFVQGPRVDHDDSKGRAGISSGEQRSVHNGALRKGDDDVAVSDMRCGRCGGDDAIRDGEALVQEVVDCGVDA